MVKLSPFSEYTHRVSYGEGTFGTVSKQLYTVLTSLQMGLIEDNMNSILSANTNSPLLNTSNDNQWFGNFQAETVNLFSGASTSTSADQSTISWEDISSLVYSDSKQFF